MSERSLYSMRSFMCYMAPVWHGTSACASSAFAPPTTNKIGAMGAMVPAYFSMTVSNWSQSERQRAVDKVNVFVESTKGKSVMVFTDGSVYDGSVGCGACAAVLVPIHGDEDKYQDSKAFESSKKNVLA